ERFAQKQGIDTGVRILGQGFASGTPETFDPEKHATAGGVRISEVAAQQAYHPAGGGPEDIDGVELHDCFTVNEILSYESLGLTPRGTA
ncbi:lipid-transfer protein, partial [Bacillus wiedmannii]|uniref:thiolase C-terminal domain-containing protein n=1 Tax=Bacillus wiedmannii TaxID=1890302 RepID=UPI003F68ABC5|nr:lipid-transfer protein [Bacillus wiedmannii]